MAISLAQLVKQIETSGLMAADKLNDCLPPNASPKSAEELAEQLVKHGWLTKFQAYQFVNGKAKALTLGNYTILDKIGAGGMGQVFKAEHRRMHRVVAIKILPANVMKDAAAVARFQREVEAAAKLEHTNIVTAYDADQSNGVHYLAMQYVEGGDLSALVKKNGPLPIPTALDYVIQAAQGLAYAHGRGVVHRDMKPANLLLGPDGVVKVLDMGLARISLAADEPADHGLTGAGQIMGTLDYMAPEQATDTKRADARSDIYSLGCTLYALLVGQPIFAGESTAQKILAHHRQPPPNLQVPRPDAAPALNDVFQKMVAKEPGDRYQTMDQVIAALETLNASSPAAIAATEPIQPPSPPPAFGALVAPPPSIHVTAGSTMDSRSTATLHGSSVTIGPNVSDPKWGWGAKLASGTFATIIAPLLVAFLMKWLDGPTPASVSPPAVAAVQPATVPSVPSAVLSQPSPPTAPTISPTSNLQPTATTSIPTPTPATASSAPSVTVNRGKDNTSVPGSSVVTLSAIPANNGAQDSVSWQDLFEGTARFNWRHFDAVPSSTWKFTENEVIAAGARSHYYYLPYNSFTNFELQVEINCDSGSNGGLYIRCQPGKPGEYPASGYEVQAQGATPLNPTGTLFKHVTNAKNASVLALAEPGLTTAGKWSVFNITADGNRLTVNIDGRKAVDYEDKQNALTSGYIALQSHTGSVRYRNLKVRPLTHQASASSSIPASAIDVKSSAESKPMAIAAPERPKTPPQGSVVGFPGTFSVVATEIKTDRRRDSFMTFSTQDSVTEDDSFVGTWRVENEKVVVQFSNPSKTAFMRPAQSGFTGQLTNPDGSVWGLQGTRLEIVGTWEHQAGTGKKSMLKFWSNGRVGKPDGNTKWSTKGNKLTLRWPSGAIDSCTITADGRRYEGKNQDGLPIHGKLVKDN